MLEIWAVLIPILIADVVNPVLFAFLVYAAGTSKPVLNSIAVLFGHTLAYFSAGIVIALGFERIADRLANPHHIDYIIGLVVGCLLLWAALRSRKQVDQSHRQDSEDLSPLTAVGAGAVVNFVGIPFALPYFAALDQILKADLTTAGALMMLVAYNLLYALPFAVVPVLTAVYREQSRPLLQRINAALDRWSSYLMPVLLAAVGVALIADAISYFGTGAGLF
ncbi:MAG: GAP family protein [Thiotrichales bacterium]|nr:MAG: GAP family protein [Thiotrichales bacterium]